VKRTPELLLASFQVHVSPINPLDNGSRKTIDICRKDVGRTHSSQMSEIKVECKGRMSFILLGISMNHILYLLLISLVDISLRECICLARDHSYQSCTMLLNQVAQ
jgi:hypothetical protein